MDEQDRPRTPPTLASVARLAGVSRQTVSNAVNNPELLRPETLARVQQVIADVGYAPNRAARNLRTRRAHLVGLQFEPGAEHTADALLDRFVHTLVDRSADAGLHVLLFSGRGLGREAGEADREAQPMAGHAELWQSGAVDAFVITDTYRADVHGAWLQAHGAPFVAFGRPWDDMAGAVHPWVDVDGKAGTQLAMRHLLERDRRRIAWLGQDPDSLVTADRRAGWVAAMDAAGLPTAGLEFSAEPTVAGGREATHRMLDAAERGEGERPEAVVAVSDTVAFGVLQALHERGLRPGADLAVTGFDDSQSAQLVPGGLTSVRQPLEQVAVELVEALGRLLGVEGHDLGDELPHASQSPSQPAARLLQPRLVVRGSST